MDKLLKSFQGIEGFITRKFEIIKDELYWEIECSKENFSCSCCDSENVTPTFIHHREVKCLPMGLLKPIISVRHHRIKCHDCGKYLMEKLEFLPKQNCNYTKSLADSVIELRRDTTIAATAKHFVLHWHTVKDIETSYLDKKYETIDLIHVRNIGIDEVYMGKKIGFLTIVRDLISSKVLFVGEGKSGETLKPFAEQLKNAKCKIENVAVDLANSFSAWIEENLPNAVIIYDKFHVIKLMNEKLNQVRRSTMNKLCEEDKKALKGKRFTLLKNIESLESDAKKDLDNIRKKYLNLGEMSMMKECLRNIYAIAEYEEHARIAFIRWTELAIKTGVGELKTMAKTITRRLDGLVAYWKDNITSASMEGFNNKIGALNRIAYGYRDLKYLKLKIFDLPNSKITNL